MAEIHVGDAIRKLREERGWNKGDLAEKANIRPNTIGDLERLGTPTMNTLRAIAHALDLSVEDIFYRLRELRQIDSGQSSRQDPEHEKLHAMLESVLQGGDTKCIKAVVAVLEAASGGDLPDSSDHRHSNKVISANNPDPVAPGGASVSGAAGGKDAREPKNAAARGRGFIDARTGKIIGRGKPD